jgi:hypothetical protein
VPVQHSGAGAGLWAPRMAAARGARTIAAMNAILGWALAALMVGAAWHFYAWQGVLVAVTAVVFWLLLQFNRAIRVMKNAASAPVGHVDSAVMFNAKLRAGMQMLKVVTLTRSLGRRVSESPEVWAWADAGASEVLVTFVNGRCSAWLLNRPTQAAD